MSPVVSLVERMNFMATVDRQLLEHLQLLEKSEQEQVLAFVKDILAGADFYDRLTEAQRLAIEKGLGQIERGETIPHAQVRKRYEKWLSK